MTSRSVITSGAELFTVMRLTHPALQYVLAPVGVTINTTPAGIPFDGWYADSEIVVT